MLLCRRPKTVDSQSVLSITSQPILNECNVVRELSARVEVFSQFSAHFGWLYFILIQKELYSPRPICSLLFSFRVHRSFCGNFLKNLFFFGPGEKNFKKFRRKISAELSKVQSMYAPQVLSFFWRKTFLFLHFCPDCEPKIFGLLENSLGRVFKNTSTCRKDFHEENFFFGKKAIFVNIFSRFEPKT